MSDYWHVMVRLNDFHHREWKDESYFAGVSKIYHPAPAGAGKPSTFLRPLGQQVPAVFQYTTRQTIGFKNTNVP